MICVIKMGKAEESFEIGGNPQSDQDFDIERLMQLDEILNTI